MHLLLPSPQVKSFPATNGMLGFNLAMIIFILLEFAVPVLPILINCAIISFMLLKRPKNAQCCFRDLDLIKMRHRAAVTTQIVTCVYFLFNVPLSIFIIFNMLIIFGAVDIDYTGGVIAIINYVTSYMYVVSVALNAACNPLVYLCRITVFRRYVVELVKVGGEQNKDLKMVPYPEEEEKDEEKEEEKEGSPQRGGSGRRSG